MRQFFYCKGSATVHYQQFSNLFIFKSILTKADRLLSLRLRQQKQV